MTTYSIAGAFGWAGGGKGGAIVDIWATSRFAGIPAMSLPCGFGRLGRPVGLQLMANHFDEARMLGAAHRFQLATDWHTRVPAGY